MFLKVIIYLILFSNSAEFGAKRVKIYSPYVIINQTGIPLEFKSSTAFIGSDQIAAGQSTDSVSKYYRVLYLILSFV